MHEDQQPSLQTLKAQIDRLEAQQQVLVEEVAAIREALRGAAVKPVAAGAPVREPEWEAHFDATPPAGPGAAPVRTRIDQLWETARAASVDLSAWSRRELALSAVRRQAETWVSSPRAWLIAASLVVGVYSWYEFLHDSTAWAVIIIWLCGLAAFLTLVAERPAWKLAVPRVELALAALVLVVGIGLRIYHVSDVPFGVNNDASYAGIIAINITHSAHYFPWSPDPTQGEAFFDYIIAGLLLLTGPGPLAVRGASMLVGIATLFSMYIFTRRVLGPRMALIATFLLATSGWDVIFSRVGWRMITVPLVETLALYFLFRAVESRKRGSFALAGALLALQLDTYPAGRIVPVIAGLWALVELARGPHRLGLLRGYLLAVAGFLFGGAAILSFAHLHPDLFNARYSDVNVMTRLLAGNWSFVWTHLKTTLGIYTVRASGNDFFLDQPLLDQPARALFLIGLPLSVWYAWRRSYRYWFVLCGLALGLLPAFVADPNGNRGFATVIFVYIVAALPLVAALELGQKLLARFASWTQDLPRLAVVIVLCATAIGTYQQYLGPDRQPMWGFSSPAAAAASYILRIDSRFDVRVTNSDAFGSGALVYLTYQSGDPAIPLTGGVQSASPHFCFKGGPTEPIPIEKVGPDKGLAFIIPPNDMPTTQEALRDYPQAKSFALMYIDGEVYSPAAWVVLVPAPGQSADADVDGPPLPL